MKELNYKALKTSKFYMILYKNHNGQFIIHYTMNIKKNTIEKIFKKWDALELISIRKISLNEYIQNNLLFSEVSHYHDNVFRVEFWQSKTFRINGLFQLDKVFNTTFPTYELTGNEIKSILDIQGNDINYVSDFILQSQVEKLDLIR